MKYLHRGKITKFVSISDAEDFFNILPYVLSSCFHEQFHRYRHQLYAYLISDFALEQNPIQLRYLKQSYLYPVEINIIVSNTVLKIND